MAGHVGFIVAAETGLFFGLASQAIVTESLPHWLVFVIDVLAAFRLTRLIVSDEFPPIKRPRDWLLRRFPSADSLFEQEDVTPDGYLRGTRNKVYATEQVSEDRFRYAAEKHHWIGDLITCPWCAGMYVAAGIVALRYLWHPWWSYVALGLALSATTGMIASKKGW